MAKRELVRSGIWSGLSVVVALAILGLSGCGGGGEAESGAGTPAAVASGNAGAADPIELWANAISSAQIDLAWSPAADDGSITSYRIWRNNTEIATLNDVTAYEDTGLSASTTYAYTVEIIDAAGNGSGQSMEAVATTPAADPTPPLVSSLSTEDGAPVAINSAISVDFSAPMSKSTLNPDTFRVDTRSGSPVPGEVSVSGNTATFTPSGGLPADTEHTATIGVGATDAAGNALESSFAATFATAAVADTTRPKVSATFPANTATNVPTNSSISAAFSETMRNSTVTTRSFRLKRSSTGSAVAGTVKIVGTTATFTPSTALAKSTQYTATITTSARDAAGNAVAANYNWNFTNGTATDKSAPGVVGRYPASGATGVALNTSVTATFSETMKNHTILTSSFRLANTSSGALVKGTVRSSLTGKSATFTPLSSLAAGTRYTATVTTATQDAAGNPLATNVSWIFTTASTLDTTAPTVSTTSPKNLAAGVALNSVVSATFSELMKSSTLTTGSVFLKKTSTGAVVTGTINVTGNTVTFDPSIALAGSTQYTATITTTAKDAAGNSLLTSHAWSFTTAPATTTAALSWDPVSVPNLSGYRIYYGTAPRAYGQAQGHGLNVGKVTTYTLSGLNSGTRYYFAATAFDATGKESSYSNEVFKDIP